MQNKFFKHLVPINYSAYIMVRLKEMLRGKVPDSVLNKLPTSFDIVGSREGAVAIVEVPEDVKEYEKMIGEAIMHIHRNVRVVLAKESAREGIFRTRRYRVIAGSGSTEVIHKEHGYRLKLDPTKVYFSPREATERLRVASQVAPGETVMVFFAGVGPYALAIAKRQPRVQKIIAIEINPKAYDYLVENIRLNRLEGLIEPVLGDVKKEASRWFGLCDRVVMPLPRGAYMFLDEAYNCLKPQGGIIHFYYWSGEDDLYSKAYYLLERNANLHGFCCMLLAARKVSPYAPRVYKVAVDVLAARA